MIPHVTSSFENISHARLIVAERASPVINEILAPVDRLPAETNGLDFNEVLELLSNAYSQRLVSLREAENRALLNFDNACRNFITLKHGDQDDIVDRREEYARSNVETTPSDFHWDSYQSEEQAIPNGHQDPINELGATPFKELEKLFPDVMKCKKEDREVWQKDVTIPEPFEMTIRDEERKYKIKSPSSDQKKTPFRFHSNPVPAHVYLPIYKLITEQSGKLRHERIENRKHKLLAEVKPFRLSYENKPSSGNLRRTRSLTNLTSTSSPKFNASPFPTHIFDLQNKNVKEIEENLRQIRIKSRAEEMMKQSSLPFTGKKILQRWNSFGSLNSKNKSTKEPLGISEKNRTSCSVSQKRTKNYDLKENRHASCIPSQSLFRPNMERQKQFSSGVNLLNYKPTKSAILREAKNSQQKVIAKEMQKRQHVELSNRLSAQQDFKREVALKVKMNSQIPSSQEAMRNKLSAYRHSQRNRSEEYAQELQEMRERLKKRPLLIEQQVQQASRNAAIKRLQSSKLVAHSSDLVHVEHSEYDSLQDSHHHSQTDNVSETASEPDVYSEDQMADNGESDLEGSLESSANDDDIEP